MSCSHTARFRWLLAAVIRATAVSCVLLPTGAAFAQTGAHSGWLEPPAGVAATVRLREAAREPGIIAPAPSLERGIVRRHGQAAPRAARRSSVGKKVLWGAIGAFGGFYAGGVIGSRIEGDCVCDDPGLKGFLIGAPIGAITGGVLGVTLAR